jgi:hypothetical protein
MTHIPSIAIPRHSRNRKRTSLTPTLRGLVALTKGAGIALVLLKQVRPEGGGADESGEGAGLEVRQLRQLGRTP